jgi:DNA (cytosine-5)-methyltransferase 1
MKYKVLDLFSGIGGFSLGLERTRGFETVAFCEIEKFPQKVLAKHWPGVPIYEDVRELTAEGLRADGIIPNVITGGFPCQDISVAGNQKGIGEGTRSGLWSECARLVGELRPDYAIFENVTALLSGESGKWFQRVLWDLSEVGYDAEWHCIPASELGAHHHRDRVWIICYPKNNGCKYGSIEKKDTRSSKSATERASFLGNSNSKRQQKLNIPRKSEKPEQPDRGCNATSDTNSQRLQRREKYGIFGEGGSRWHELTTGRFCGFQDISEIEPTVCRGVNGIPNYAHRLKGLGNAVVPQIPELIGRAILDHELLSN